MSARGYIMIGRNLPKNRKFNIEFRYYDPQKEEREHRQMKFKRNRSLKQAKQRSVIWLFVLLIGVLYALYTLGRVGIK
jgi:hypothetical protein